MPERWRALGVIPARGGSKSVPRKNLHPLGGRPLLAWTIASALAAKSLDRLIVSTDDADIAALARGAGAEVPFLRPAAISADDTPDLPVFQHVLAELKTREGYVPDAIVHLRPTQPFRTAGEIDAVAELLRTSGADCVKSVRPVGEHPFKMYRIHDGRLAPYLDTEERRRRGPDVPRQSLEPVYLSAGVVDAVRREVIEAGSTEGRVVVPYLVDVARYVNLDSVRDFEIAEALVKSLGLGE
ncbi:MAG: acylneuraminate cytidylyltransferase family protein [Candidatus Rokubacteria bacterium]|nr:acylneuraminate cytidylyltransferase family protein [Candidatus Rokubacteria bacterium]